MVFPDTLVHELAQDSGTTALQVPIMIAIMSPAVVNCDEGITRGNEFRVPGGSL